MFEIKGFTPRLYQQTILNTTIKNNTLVCLPTGRGKTKIALLAAIHRLNNFPNSKVVFLTPTKPLAAQIAEEFKENSTIEKVNLFTGETKPEEREKIFKESDVIISTPQGMSNDIINGKIDLRNVSMIVLDECQHAIGEYDYVWIAKQYQRLSLYPRIIGLSASPGSDLDKITEVCQNLFIEDIEVRTDEDPDLKPYVQETRVDYLEIELPKEFKEARDFLQKGYKTKLNLLKQLNATDTVNIETKTQLLMAQKELQKRLATGERDIAMWQAISTIAEAMKIQYCIELLETQGIGATYEYMKKLNKEAETTKVKATKNLVVDENFKAAYFKVTNLFETGEEHPKIGKLIELIKKEVERCDKILIFNNYRDSASKLKTELNKIEGVKCELFVGQAKKNGTGLTQKKQIQLLEDYKEGKFNTIIGTSVDPEEFIILKSPNDSIEIKKIGEFVDSFISTNEDISSISKRIEGWKVLSTNNIVNDFYPITQVHKHKRRSNVVNVVLSSGFRCKVTEDHSLFTFNYKGQIISTKPEINKFVNIANSSPNNEHILEIDVLKELYLNAPKTIQQKIFCNFIGLSQAKIRMTKTELKLLSQLDNKVNQIKLSKISELDPSTISSAIKRLEKKGFVERRINGRECFYLKTTLGEEYLLFLKWFFKYQYYHKKKYRISLKDAVLSPKIIHKFCDLRVGIWYGKITVSPLIKLNKYLAELLGWYVSEGDAKYNKHSSDIYLASIKPKIQKRIAKCIIKGLKLKPSITWRGVALNAQIAHHLIKYVFKCGVGAYNKEIPQIIFSAPLQQKIQFLKGYTRGDGYISKEKDRIILTTSSRKLATGLIFLLRQIGIKKITLGKDHCYRIRIYESLPFAKIKEKKGKRTYYDTTPSALISNKDFNKYRNFYIDIPKNGGNGPSRKIKTPDKTICFDYIKKLEPVTKQPEFVYDISVKGTERFYGGPGLICLHNSVGEEGIDIPAVDLIVFYEPVPSAIRTVQRRGRTGRQEKGRVIVLVTKGTRDEAYRWTAFHKEKRMHSILKDLKNKLMLSRPKEVTLSNFSSKIKIYADSREKASGVMKYLVENNVDVKMQNLEVGDFQLSADVIVERKEIKDFVDSIIDKRLLDQVKDIKQNFEKPLIIIEGDDDLYSVRNIHANAIRGMLAWITIDMKIPVIHTRDYRDTAEMLITIAKREQGDSPGNFSIRGEKKPLSDKELKEFIIAGLPGVGTQLARNLLEEFRTVKNVVNASNEELQKVEKIGKKKADDIRKILDGKYDTPNS